MTKPQTRELNKRTGSFYTPKHIAEFIVNRSIGKWIERKSNCKPKQEYLESLRAIRILDPSVGDGVFLLAAARWLLKAREKCEDGVPSSEIRRDIAVNNLYGVDVQKSAVQDCKSRISKWVNAREEMLNQELSIHEGNSLVGKIGPEEEWFQGYEKGSIPFTPLHWYKKFPEIFSINGGFDIIVGNPPYGNILSSEEKEVVKISYSYDVMKGRKGTWNAAPLFMVRANQLINDRGEIGFLVPNSILRVGQFSRTRRFLLEEANIWCIIDEGNPFEEVTLEMVSIFWNTQRNDMSNSIEIVSKRQGIEGIHEVSRSSLSSSNIFSLYYDDIMNKVQEKGERGLIKASRGRDIPSNHVNYEQSKTYSIPYATKGRSVQRYRVEERHLKYTDNWYKQDEALRHSFSNEFLIATKNYPYPRCVMKPKGMIHGGGVVKIIPLIENMNMAAIGLILNSKLVRYLSSRYLTNYAQLTTCLNTGIMEEIPISYPRYPDVFACIFDNLQKAYNDDINNWEQIEYLESYANAVVYAQYFMTTQMMNQLTNDFDSRTRPKDVRDIIGQTGIKNLVKKIMQNPIVIRIETSPRMN